MNIIDRSPMKTSAHEALLAQSARQISEAKTAEEKASVVQNFAEQLRLEKLRTKRLQENMRELNHAISNGAPSMVGVARPQGPPMSTLPPSNVKLNVLNPNINVADARIAFVRQETGNRPMATPTWVNPNGGHFDLFRNGAGNINGLGNAIKPDVQQRADFGSAGAMPTNIGLGMSHHFPNMMPFPNSMKSVPPAVPLTSSSPSSMLTPSSRPLNVNAAPFTMQPKSFGQSAGNAAPLQQQRPASSNAMREVLFRRMTASPPITSPTVAVAPKANVMDMGRESRTTIPTMEGRPRSSSIGSQQRPNYQQQQQVPGHSEAGSMSGMGRGGVIYYQQHKLTSPILGRGPFSQLNKDSDLPKPNQQLDDASKPKPRMGTVKIDNTASSGSSLLQSEDWDVEYAEPKEQQRPKKETTPDVEKPAGFAPPMATENKDWLAVLKERDDMAKRRYSRDVMIRLIQSEASKIRPSHLSPEYDNDVGLWSPDLWFFINFQKGQQQVPMPANRNVSTFGRGGTASGFQQNPQSVTAGLRRVSCLTALQQKQPQERSLSSD